MKKEKLQPTTQSSIKLEEKKKFLIIDNGKDKEKLNQILRDKKPCVAFCESSSLRLCYVLLNLVLLVYECETLLIISKNQA